MGCGARWGGTVPGGPGGCAAARARTHLTGPASGCSSKKEATAPAITTGALPGSGARRLCGSAGPPCGLGGRDSGASGGERRLVARRSDNSCVQEGAPQCQTDVGAGICLALQVSFKGR